MFKLKLQNFRSFLDEEFSFSRINILIGENSSGKSSILKFLLVLKQSLQVPLNSQFNMTFRGELTDLGSYRDTVYYNDENRPLKFSFSFDNQYYKFFLGEFGADSQEINTSTRIQRLPIKFRQRLNPELDKIKSILEGSVTATTELSYSLTNELDRHDSITTVIINEAIGKVQIIHASTKDKKIVFNEECQIIFYDYKDDSIFDLSEVEYEKQGYMTIIVGSSLRAAIKSAVHDTNVPLNEENEQVDYLFYRIAYLLISQNYLNSILDKIEYFNPLLTKPSRVYLARDPRRNLIINDIEDVVDYLSANTPESKEVLDDLNNILTEFGIAEGIEIIQDNRMLVKELRVKIKDLFSNIFDVGYGVSLQIPMILKALLAEKTLSRKNTVLLIEQPEVHLHPRLHAVLIEVFLKLGNSNIYFIETHSEHIIRKLQVVVKNKKYDIKSEDVSINYLTRKANETTISKHIILNNGFLSPNFPSGFFDASYNLSKELLG